MTTKSDETYQAHVKCKNCGMQTDFLIPTGVLIEVYLVKNKIICRVCKCKLEKS